MSLEKIIERIERDAQSEADRIIDRANAAADDMIQKAQNEADEQKSQMVEEAEVNAEQRKERIISTARLDLRKATLSEKQKAIDAAFQKAIQDLIKTKDTEYRKLMKQMILSNVQTGEEEVILSKKDKTRLGNNFLKELNNELKKNKKNGKLILSDQTYDMLGGFVLKRGKIELNGSFESLFKSSRDDLEAEVSKILFPKLSES
ncbi:hypothetical protein GF312_02970 [Candidatus Poribacteria bacterium]|nr:hypothetical protein [Candidatus Poribacteria bacterium]